MSNHLIHFIYHIQSTICYYVWDLILISGLHLYQVSSSTTIICRDETTTTIDSLSLFSTFCTVIILSSSDSSPPGSSTTRSPSLCSFNGVGSLFVRYSWFRGFQLPHHPFSHDSRSYPFSSQLCFSFRCSGDLFLLLSLTPVERSIIIGPSPPRRF